ncbi:hypothetical protein QV06_10725 [Gallibacterium genomosp. 3]|uniref:Uncharacterized protein n=1 Tax=Gallibacterium genomosp. 3 TaxID=505345 RepID=A0A1A7PNP9_9PAST|nr:hypothetical protein [Gallibacterium genomosp. 3]OBX02790.1 hypothetical protein QV06_10725 [Gallibacterium genomosp. 3]
MDTGNYGADRLGGSFGKNDRMDSETNHGKNHDGDYVSLSRGSDGRDRVTVSHKGSSRSYSLNDYVSRNKSAWGSQGLSPISQAATVTRTTVTSLTGAKQTTLSGQPIEDPNNSLLSTNPDKYLEKTIGKGFVDYIDNPVTNKMGWESYQDFREQGKQFKASNLDRTFGLNTVGEVLADTVAGVAGKVGKGVGSVASSMGAGVASTNLGNLMELASNYAKTKNMTDAQKAAFADGVNEINKAINDGKSTLTKFFEAGSGLATIPDPITMGVGVISGLFSKFTGHEDKKKAVATAMGKLDEYEKDRQKRHQALLDDAKRRSLDGSNQGNYGILNQMTARLNKNTQPVDKWQQFNATLPALNHLWDSISFKTTT